MVLEDLDHVEARRRELRKSGKPLPEALKGTAVDPQLHRKLLHYMLPYRRQMLAAVVLSAVAATARVGYYFALEGLLGPLFKAGAARQPVPLGRMLHHLTRAAGPDGVHPIQSVLGALGDATAWVWSTFAPLEQLRWAAYCLVLLVIFEQANKYTQRLLMRTVSIDIVRTLRVELFERLMAMSLRFFHRNHSGKLMSRVTTDIMKLGELLIDVMVNVFSDVFTVIGSLLFVYFKGGAFVIVALGLAGITFVPIQQLGRRIRGKENTNRRKLSEVFQSLSEALANQKIVKAFTAEAHEVARFREVNDRVLDGRLKSAELRARTEPVVEVVGAVAVSAFMLWGGRMVIEGEWEGEAFFAVVMALFTVVASLRRLADTSTKFQSGLSAADRVATLLYTRPEIVDSPDAVKLETFRDSIVFDHVDYAYDADHPVLRDVCFELRRGQTLAIVGHTGSGKSTIGDLLPRFYDVCDGAVRIDGHDVRDLSVKALRHLVAMVTQETVLFQGTVRSNIAYAMADVSDADIEAAARGAHAHEFIVGLPHGYDTHVGERGASLSGGERQRIAIARALLSKAPIMILDEATSALDTRSEKIVQEAIDNLRQGHTAIIIAHRLSTIRDADQILVLERGAIVERGTHDQLMALEGVYSRMIRIQSSDRQAAAT